MQRVLRVRLGAILGEVVGLVVLDLIGRGFQKERYFLLVLRSIILPSYDMLRGESISHLTWSAPYSCEDIQAGRWLKLQPGNTVVGRLAAWRTGQILV